MPYQFNVTATSVPCRCHISVCAMWVPYQCHVNATSMPCQCHAGAMPMPCRSRLPCQCHIRANSALSVPFHRYVRHVNAMPMLGLNVTSLCHFLCHVSAMPMPCQCHVSAMSVPCQCHVNATSVPCRATPMSCQCHVLNAMSSPCLALRSDGAHNSRGALPQTESGLGIALSNVHQQHYESY